MDILAQARDAVEERLKWKLEDIYETDAAFNDDCEQLEKLFRRIPEIRQQLTGKHVDAKTLTRCLQEIEQMEHIAGKLFVYARMRRDEDNNVAKYQAMTSRARDLNVRLSSELSFVNPALLSMPQKRLKRYIHAAKISDMEPGEKRTKKLKKLRENKKHRYSLKTLELLGQYGFMLEELLRYKPHVLSPKEERLLAMAGQVTGAPKDIFGMLNDADLKFGQVKDADGHEVELTHGSYIVLMQSPDREVRRAAYDQLYDVYHSFINTISTTYASSVRKDSFVAEAKHFPHAIDRALFADNVPVELYHRLIDIIHENLPIMYDYVSLRKEILGVDELHMYDVYAPLVPDQNKNYTYDDGIKLVEEGLSVLGPEYQKLLKRAVADRWIDVVETAGKTSGAYSWGTYGVHPYVLLNHRGDLDSVFTIAHELGHAMHSYFSNLNQPESKAGYSIFVAEVASTVNEILLTKHLLSTVTDRDERLNVLNHYLDQFRTTVVRQTMFAEFEEMTHSESEKGIPLTHESLCEMYGSLNAKYYGSEMAKDDRIIYEWARIPHFYNAFYVYKYATGFSCAVKIATDITSGKKNAVRDYIRFLSSGGSDYPLELLKIAHVDLLEGEPVRECMREFERTLREFRSTMSE